MRKIRYHILLLRIFLLDEKLSKRRYSKIELMASMVTTMERWCTDTDVLRVQIDIFFFCFGCCCCCCWLVSLAITCIIYYSTKNEKERAGKSWKLQLSSNILDTNTMLALVQMSQMTFRHKFSTEKYTTTNAVPRNVISVNHWIGERGTRYAVL